MPVDRHAGALEVAGLFAALSEELLAEHDEKALLDTVCQRAGEFVPGVDFSGITLRGPRRRLETACETGEIARHCDALQRELGEGPCLEAAHDVQRLFVSADVACDERWPRWGPRAAELGARALLSVQLSSGTISDEHAPLGALNLYGSEPDRFGEHEVEVARLYGLHAANALAQARLLGGLRTAVESRHAIGIAQGILAQRYEIDADTAFDVLQRYSTTTNTKLRHVARQVVEGGGLPEQRDDEPPQDEPPQSASPA